LSSFPALGAVWWCSGVLDPAPGRHAGGGAGGAGAHRARAGSRPSSGAPPWRRACAWRSAAPTAWGSSTSPAPSCATTSRSFRHSQHTAHSQGEHGRGLLRARTHHPPPAVRPPPAPSAAPGAPSQEAKAPAAQALEPGCTAGVFYRGPSCRPRRRGPAPGDFRGSFLPQAPPPAPLEKDRKGWEGAGIARGRGGDGGEREQYVKRMVDEIRLELGGAAQITVKPASLASPSGSLRMPGGSMGSRQAQGARGRGDGAGAGAGAGAGVWGGTGEVPKW